MKITSIRLLNFKRFTDLIVREIPETAKLVVVVGPNGSGKSSLFDALLQWYRYRVGLGINSDMSYYRKSETDNFDWGQSVEVTLAGNAAPERGSLYIRSAYRNDPDFLVSGISRLESPTEGVRLGRFIENDQTVSENYQRLVYDTMSAVYDTGNDAKSVGALREELIGQVRASMRAVFGDLILNNITDPLGAGAFFFEKGTALSYHYKNLSGGEKSAFDLLLDMHIKKKFYPDAIYCFDEIETHLHTKIQGTLLNEMVNILPGQSQMWVTTHSLGVLRAAQELGARSPGSVCVIDFDSIDPDVPREITPSNLGRVSWEKMLSIALDDLSPRVAPGVLVVCEGSSIGTRRKDFDAEIYNRILGSFHADVLFISGGSSAQVGGAGVSIRQTLGTILPTTKIVALCDRDSKSNGEVQDFERTGNIVLSERNLESFIFGDDVITALVNREQKPELLADALEVKAAAIRQSVTRGNPADDLKSAAGDIYTGLQRLLRLSRAGNNTDMFMRDTLAPLIVAPMPSYLALKSAVIDRIANLLSRIPS